MTRVFWSAPALQETESLVEWLRVEHRPKIAARVATDVAGAVQRAAATPEAFAWVGSVYPELAGLPATWRRVLTRTRRHSIFYRYVADQDYVEILAVRSAGQLPPVMTTLTTLTTE